MKSPLSQKLTEVAALFLKLGITAFGGPAAHIAMMHNETVKRRKWLSDQEFLDLVGATNLIPGPNSTEMAIHIGFLRVRWESIEVSYWVSCCYLGFLVRIFLKKQGNEDFFDRGGTSIGSCLGHC